MACCYTDDCGECGYAVSPCLVAPCYPTKYCEEPPMCCPYLPHCPKGVVYCCEKRPPKAPRPTPVYCEPEECCDGQHHHHHHHCHYSPTRCRVPRSPPPPTRKTSVTANCPSCSQPVPVCKPIKTKYVMPCYRYEDGRIVRQLPVSAFKRNGMQDQEHSKMLGTTNFLKRCSRDVMIECEICVNKVKVGDPAKVPPCTIGPALGQALLQKKPIKMNQPTVLMRRACEVAVGTRLRKKPFVVSSFSADQSSEVRRYHSEDERGNCCFHFERKKKYCDPQPLQQQLCHPPQCYPPQCHPSQCEPPPCLPPLCHPPPCEPAPCRPLPCHPPPCLPPPCLPPPGTPCRLSQLCTSSPECQYVECVHAKLMSPPKSCCFYRV